MDFTHGIAIFLYIVVGLAIAFGTGYVYIARERVASGGETVMTGISVFCGLIGVGVLGVVSTIIHSKLKPQEQDTDSPFLRHLALLAMGVVFLLLTGLTAGRLALMLAETETSTSLTSSPSPPSPPSTQSSVWSKIVDWFNNRDNILLLTYCTLGISIVGTVLNFGLFFYLYRGENAKRDGRNVKLNYCTNLSLPSTDTKDNDANRVMNMFLAVSSSKDLVDQVISVEDEQATEYQYFIYLFYHKLHNLRPQKIDENNHLVSRLLAEKWNQGWSGKTVDEVFKSYNIFQTFMKVANVMDTIAKLIDVSYSQRLPKNIDPANVESVVFDPAANGESHIAFRCNGKWHKLDGKDQKITEIDWKDIDNNPIYKTFFSVPNINVVTNPETEIIGEHFKKP